MTYIENNRQQKNLLMKIYGQKVKKKNKYKQLQFSKKGSNVQNLRRCQRSRERGGFKQQFERRQCLTVLRQLDS